jgi:hypothetical protein
MAPVLAQTGNEGRQVAPLTNENGVSYERKCLKRTVSLESLQGWDLLYSLGESRVFFDWDERFLYLAVAAPVGQEVRFDLDASGDGWFKGAENFSVRVIPTAQGMQPFVRRFDTLQNKEHPVWAELEFPAGALEGRVLKTEQESVTLVALPIALLGTGRKPGVEFGLRVLVGNAALAEPAPDQPLLRLQLAEESEAIAGPLSVRLNLRNREYVAGGLVRGSLELANSGAKPLFLKQIFFPDGTVISNPKDPILILNPGERVKRDFRMVVPEGPEPASLVLRGGAEREEGAGTVAALLSIDRLEPFSFVLDPDAKPVLAAAPQGPARQRLVVATITGRREGKMMGLVQLTLPTGWSMEGDAKRAFSLSYPNERRSVSFKVVVPAGVPAGSYPVESLCEIGGKTFRAKVSLTVQ